MKTKTCDCECHTLIGGNIRLKYCPACKERHEVREIRDREWKKARMQAKGDKKEAAKIWSGLKIKSKGSIGKSTNNTCLCHENPSGLCMACVNKALWKCRADIVEKVRKLLWRYKENRIGFDYFGFLKELENMEKRETK